MGLISRVSSRTYRVSQDFQKMPSKSKRPKFKMLPSNPDKFIGPKMPKNINWIKMSENLITVSQPTCLLKVCENFPYLKGESKHDYKNRQDNFIIPQDSNLQSLLNLDNLINYIAKKENFESYCIIESISTQKLSIYQIFRGELSFNNFYIQSYGTSFIECKKNLLN